VEIRVDGVPHDPGAIPPDTLLVHVLQKRLGIEGIRKRCMNSRCGGCRVLLDGQPVKSCEITWDEAAGRDVELLGESEDTRTG
jgi:isoquinoline 1-oxidoreductase alpha subunit